MTGACSIFPLTGGHTPHVCCKQLVALFLTHAHTHTPAAAAAVARYTQTIRTKMRQMMIIWLLADYYLLARSPRLQPDAQSPPSHTPADLNRLSCRQLTVWFKNRRWATEFSSTEPRRLIYRRIGLQNPPKPTEAWAVARTPERRFRDVESTSRYHAALYNNI